MTITNPPRECERQCKECGEWKHYSRFRSYHTKHGRNDNISAISFSPICRDCEQKKRNEKKNIDRALAIIQGRAKTAARKAGVKSAFFWIQMNYRSLVPIVRVLMGPEGNCQGCGHAFVDERDIQIEHLEPPRHEQDWARLHARNLRMSCASCNKTKGKKPFGEWLDEQEGARISNLVAPAKVEKSGDEKPWYQADLFRFVVLIGAFLELFRARGR